MADKALMQLIAIDRDQASRNSTWRVLLDQNADALEAAIKQREQDAKYAARYRWLRDMRNREQAAMLVSFKMNLDAAIDTAMAKESPNG